MKQVIKGNYAVSHGVRLSRVQVISAYPITPQTSIVEELSRMCAEKELDAKFIKVESEHSALAAVVGSATAGVRSFTATSGNGLLLMHEVLHWAAGARLPIVMANVNRAVGPGWNIWADQTDSLAQRDTGWLQIYCESNQEVLDNVILAYKLAEKIMLPVMLTYDAFFLSHTSEIVDIPEIEEVDRFLPPYQPKFRLDIKNPLTFGGLISPDYYYEQRYVMHRDSLSALDYYPEIAKEFGKQFKRNYGLLEEYKTEDAEILVACAGTISSVTRLAVDEQRKLGNKVGLVKIRFLRPVPVQAWQKAFGKAKKIAVIDRNLSIGLGGVFNSEIQAVLNAGSQRPVVFPIVAGMGGRDVTSKDITGILDHVANHAQPIETPLFWGLKQ
ncbi:MAG: pyruvate ferredoxin oxidoreductase [Desulfobacteraceae bacterium]|nr:MAG: pyruvate ferredoxin oxidoreductase [Desulfobacteraceae bacterium]